MADYETILDNVIENHKSATGSLWQCAEGVYELFEVHGKYERDFVAVLESELAVGADTIYHWRKAWGLRQEIESKIGEFDIGVLTISHFYTAADYLERLGVEWVYDWLTVAQEEKWSSRKLAAEMRTATDESGTYGWMKQRLVRVTGILEKLYAISEMSGLSDTDRGLVRDACDMLLTVIK